MQQLRRRRPSGSLAVVVGCTSSKSLPVPPRLRLADLARDSQRSANWSRRLSEAQARLPLRALYTGAQWRASLDLERQAGALGHHVDLWVVSAGLGLVPASTAAPAYAASFSQGPDAVADAIDGRREWWGLLLERTCSFKDLAARYDQQVVVLAPSYLQVVGPALAQLRGRGLAVVSSLRDDLVYSSSGLRPALRASAMSLNAAAAAQLLVLAGDEPLCSDGVRARWKQWSTENARRGAISRRVATDEDVIAYITSNLAEAHVSRSALLTRFRAQGRACQQSRFQRHYEYVLGSYA